METRQTMIISASITAYSTAVGPSSLTRNCLTFKAKAFMTCSLEASCGWATPRFEYGRESVQATRDERMPAERKPPPVIHYESNSRSATGQENQKLAATIKLIAAISRRIEKSITCGRWRASCHLQIGQKRHLPSFARTW